MNVPLVGRLEARIRNYRIKKKEWNNPRLSEEVIKNYSDDSLSGYGDKEYTKGGMDIQHQQRGLILPLLEQHIKKQETVIEIGTGNGDVVAYLADKYPDTKFIGIDFSVKNAMEKHQKKNLSFISGYALDLLAKRVRGDLIFASSTFCNFTPRELENYLVAIRRAGVHSVILNEPTWGGHIQKNNGSSSSIHLDGAVWHHNYCGYLWKADFSIADFSFFHYKHPVSLRPDIFICLVRGEVSR